MDLTTFIIQLIQVITQDEVILRTLKIYDATKLDDMIYEQINFLCKTKIKNNP